MAATGFGRSEARSRSTAGARSTFNATWCGSSSMTRVEMSEPVVKKVVETRVQLNGSVHIDWRLDSGDGWCTVHLSADRESAVVISYGGEVWPSAYPAIFDVGSRTTHGQTTRLTERGLALAIASADGVSGNCP